ncbi:MAG: cell division protein ZapA [Candidatus Latescibacteria bacterium]|nr:cell division protein ZapA [Candidatus Latescibacterota bacterium]NIM21524.1 cell division protein ZapA [Candidatus Latescibacterota bacterium]NIM65695.1 cell division protein ZapA [Candidatus Latescibacterota bacterium]NIO02077.1 cell division protein ZapA [Candidatus Latescibacterota bacterium]NIO28889.1 cell division protein ZapA [Candidatus Latescibacterota bacterium]
MDEMKATTVHIMGREYKIKGFADKNYIIKVAEYVDEKMRELSKNSSLASHDKIAILAALNIADELFQERQKMSETFSSIERKADDLIEILEKNSLAGG